MTMVQPRLRSRPLKVVSNAAPPPTVRLSGFTRRFGDNVVIDGLDLTIAPGEFVALLGASGSGKTTLLRTLAGLDSAQGQDVTTPDARAVVFQDARLLPWKTIWRNVALGLKGKDIRARAEAALKEVGLGHRLDAWPAPPWPGPWSASRPCCCWTSPSRRWTPSPA